MTIVGARIMTCVYCALAAVGAWWTRGAWRKARRSGMEVRRRGRRRYVVLRRWNPDAFDWRTAPPEGKEG